MALGAVQLFFGLFPVMGGMAMDPVAGFSPFAVACWRIGVGALVLLPMAYAAFGRRAIPALRDFGPLAGFAFLGIVLNQGLFLVGLQKSTPMNAGLVICLIPVFAYSVAVLGRRETFHPRRALGVLVALGGAIPLFVARGGDLAPEHALGNLLMAANALCYAFYLVYSKPLLRRMPPLVLVAWVYVLSLPWLPLFAAGQDLAPATASTAAWWSLAYVIVFPTILAYALNSYALARVEASTTAFFVFAQPVITALSAWIFLKEVPTPALGLAASGLFLGMALVIKRPAPRPVVCPSGT
ncbi:putative DMT superfamily transporter inner membrane protein [Planctomycetes bacterium Poly30]|uniref:Putative DMT superfamily transporter inner membrane protein n=2 Tax=Saltatorellus ferox TaxID=2528018 RepID=A0A518EVK3_9BACT|nr:putative DMT superfamily transporter inner membrane protein [Planctomycetes bacterium Poly30]